MLAFLDSLTEAISGSAATYPLVAAICAGDAVLPILPGETAVVTAAALASEGRGLVLWIVVVAAAMGAFVGDNISYLLGRTLGERAARRVFRGERSRRRLDWARDQIAERGVVLVIAARFLPGGRTATTFAAGAIEMGWRRFAIADVAGATLWAAYASGAGFVGGTTFQEDPWMAVAASLGIALVVAALVEAIRRLRVTA